MGSKKSFIKGLAAGAVLAAAAKLYLEMKDEKSEKRKEFKQVKKIAGDIADRVAKKAKRLGKLTKSAYGKIVDTTVAEYKGVKLLSEDELKELKAELRDSWKDVHAMMLKKDGKKKK